jgi:hypothetical protein
MLDMAMNVYGKPTHAQHVYLPYYQGQMQYTRKFTIFIPAHTSSYSFLSCLSISLTYAG